MTPITSLVPYKTYDGENNWYKTNTEITFNCISDGLYQIYYKWDGLPTWKQFAFSNYLEVLSVFSDGTENYGYLFNSPVILDGLQLYRNLSLMTYGSDYSINISDGKVSFLTPIVANDIITAKYNYTISESETYNGLGGETSIILLNSHITEITLTINNVIKKDATYDYNDGVVYFAKPLVVNDIVVVDYKYVYLDNAASVLNEVVIASAIGGSKIVTLSYDVLLDSELITHNNIPQNKPNDYTISGSTITFDYELKLNDIVSADYLASITSEAVTTAIAGQKVCYLAHGNVVDYSVYVNAIYQNTLPEYTISGSLLTLSDEAFPTGLTATDTVYAAYTFKQVSENTVPSATIGQTNFSLFYGSIQSGSVRILKNNKVLAETTDYSLTYSTGVVVLTSGMTSGDVITADYIASTSEVVVISATGGEKILQLNHDNIVEISTVIINSLQVLKSKPDYTLDTATGSLVFTNALSLNDVVTATYSFTHNEAITIDTSGELELNLDNAVVDSVVLKKNTIIYTDYLIDYISGTITLGEPLQDNDAITASYTYYKSQINEMVSNKLQATYPHLLGSNQVVLYKNSVIYTNYTYDFTTGLITLSGQFLTSDVFSIDYSYAPFTTQNELFFGPASVFTLTYDLPFDVVVMKGIVQLDEYTDFNLNYDTGVITLTIPLSSIESIQVSYKSGGNLTIPSTGVHAIEFYAIDINNVKESIKTGEYSLDPLPPITIIDIPSGIQTEPVTINFFSSDSISGVDKTFYTTDGSTPTTESQYDSFTLTETKTIKFFSVDFAGNQEVAQSALVEVFVDTVAPTVHIQESFPIDGLNGYYQTLPQISIIVTDELNLDKIYYKLVSQSNITTAKYTSPLITTLDLSSVYNINLEIDQSGTGVEIDLRGFEPATTTISDIITNINSATRTIYNVIDENSKTNGFTLKTNNPNIRSISRIRNVTTNEFYTYISKSYDTVVFTGITAPKATDVMAVSYEYQSQDIAFETAIDATQGTGYITILSPTAGTGSPNSEIKFLQPSTADATQLVFGLGTTYPYTFVETNVFIEYTGPITLPNNGRYSLQAYAQDIYDNKGVIVERNYQVDSNEPISSTVIIGGVLGNNNYYVDNPIIRFVGTDNLSGLNQIFYKWDAGTYKEYRDTRPLDDSTEIPSDGNHILYYYGTDRAGNTETVNQSTFKLDLISPVTTDNTTTSTIDINHLVISKSGPPSVLNISNNIMYFSGSEPAGPFDLRYFTLQDIVAAINGYSGVGYSASLVADPSYLSEAQLLPATLLFETNNISITATNVLIYAGIAIKLFATDVTSGIENVYYSYTTNGAVPPTPTTAGYFDVINEQLVVRNAGSYIFNSSALGGETEAKILNQPIYSLVLYKNPGSTLLVESVDYTIDKSSGKITLTNPLIIGQSLLASYTHGVFLPFSNDGIYRVKYYAVDNAGNIEVTKNSNPITIVRNVPMVSFTPDISPQISGWYTSNPNITILATAITGTITQLLYRWNSDPFTVISNPSVVTIPSDGIHDLEAYAIDSLFRVSPIYIQEFKKDVVAPVSTDNSVVTVVGEVVIASASGFETTAYLDSPYISGQTIYKNTVPLIFGVDYAINTTTGLITFLFTLTPSDQITADYQHLITSNSAFNLLINISDAESGSDKTYYEVGTVTSPPAAPTLLSPSLTGSNVSIPLTTTDQWIVKYRSLDVAGNLENTKTTSTIRINTTLPVSTLVFNPTLADGENGFYTSVILSFSVNTYSAGLKETYYKLTNIWVLYTSPFTVPDGIYNLQYYSIDLAGNIETVKTTVVKQDAVAPVTTDSIPNGFVSSSSVSLITQDSTSGIYKTYHKVLTSGLLPVNLKVVTNIFIENAVAATQLKTPNVFLYSGSEVIYADGFPLINGVDYTINYDYGIISFIAPVTGVITADYQTYVNFNGSNDGKDFNVTAEGDYVIQYFSIDYAGNYEAVKTATNLLKIDLTPPVVYDIYPTDLIITDTTNVLGFKVKDVGVNPSGIDPFSIRVFVDGIEYSLLKNTNTTGLSAPYFIMKASNTAIQDIVSQTSILTNEILESSALGGEQNFTLANISVAYKTQKVYKNDILIQEDLDYVFDNANGKLSLIIPLLVNETLKITYRYLTFFHNEYEVAICASNLITDNITSGSLSYLMTNGVAESVHVTDGVPLIDGVDFTVTGNTVNFVTPTSNAVINYNSFSGSLMQTIPNFDVISSIVIDPRDASGNILLPISFDFSDTDTTPPFVTELNPQPNSKDVSLYTNIMFNIFDDHGVNIETVYVDVNNVNYRLETEKTITFQYLGVATTANLTIVNNYFITRINGQIDISFSFLDAKYSTIQQVVDHLNSLPTYTASLVDSKFSQESSLTLIGVRSLDIIPPVYLNSKPLINTRFSYIEKTNGYLITITPDGVFKNKEIVSVVINAKDNNNNIMPQVSYSFETQLGASESISKRLVLISERDLITKDINNNIGSNYNKKSNTTEIYTYHSVFATELSQLKYKLVQSLNNYYFTTVDDHLLWQNFGALIDFLSSESISTDEYRNLLLSISKGYHDGSLKSSIQEAISLFTNGNVYVRERYLNSSDLSEQFVFDVLVDVTNNNSILSLVGLLNTDLYKVIRKIKPAHTFFLLGFLFIELISIADGCDPVLLEDPFGYPILDYYGNPMVQSDGNSYRFYKNNSELIEVQDFLLYQNIIQFNSPLVTGDIITGDYKKYYTVDEIITGTVGTFTCQLSSFPVVPMSYKVYRNEILLHESIDYSIDLVLGVVTLFSVLLYSDIIEIKYDWFIQELNQYIYTATGGEYNAPLLEYPIVKIQFEKRVPKTSTAICDRSFIKYDTVIPYIDFKLNGKPKFFTLNADDLNDIAQIVDTHWLADDAVKFEMMFFETFPSITESVSISITTSHEDDYILPIEDLSIEHEISLLEDDLSFYLTDPVYPNSISRLSNSLLNSDVRVLWKGIGKMREELRRLQLN